ncbi:hypothetical protein PTSG_06381 [Salpingoeca rosetta]|uniref:Uncharacterized protein n=1 Tax=Salpingoeca rosetta (strain ATCC 50818 / BSB-021) TaxID=946362 RepID=F2UCR3_SALR5|nr:uncharacterized protein PTSG_06381 [Salpingoeca rosetta]EGD74370.1 hypothetical protein PTSG_06381 [Salpingoeca rosetta]|eukprot:XP_004993270.1 hypothetical protein PTSG_06381 [Salpingoeca rosetta]
MRATNVYQRHHVLSHAQYHLTMCIRWSKAEGGVIRCFRGQVPRIGSLVDASVKRCGCYDPMFAAQHTDKLKVVDGCDPKASECKTSIKDAKENHLKNQPHLKQRAHMHHHNH